MTRNAVVMACDAGYAPYAFCLAESIIAAHPDRTFDICVFSEDSLILPRELSESGIKLVTLPTNNPFRDTPNPSRHGTSTYLRLLVPGAIARDYDRILYLDSDIIFRGPDLEKIFSMDLHGRVLAAVRDNQQWRTPTHRIAEFTSFSLPQAAYFNAGVLLIDVAQFNEDRILERTMDILANRPEALIRHDQSLLNIVLHGKWTEISPIWNWQYTWASRFFTFLAEPRLIHFIGPRKPWKDTKGAMPASFRNLYRSFQERHYPDRPEICQCDVEQMGWPEGIVKSFLKHAITARKLRTYLARFPATNSSLPV